MNKKIDMTRRQAEGLLVLVILARSTSYVMTKTGLQSMGSFTLLGFRFIIAFLILLLLGGRRLRGISGKTVFRGMLLGASFFSVMAAEVSGLQTANASTAAFLENMAIVFVPLIGALLARKLPGRLQIASALLCLGGVGLLTLKSGTYYLSQGEMLCLLAAGLYAVSIIITDRVSKQDDPLTLGILQVGFMGLFSMAAAFLFETPRIPAAPSEWSIILGLSVICSAFGFTLQPFAQSKTTAERAGLFCALGPVGASVCGMVFLDERLGAAGFGGILLILAGMSLTSLYQYMVKNLKRTAKCIE